MLSKQARMPGACGRAREIAEQLGLDKALGCVSVDLVDAAE